MIRWLLLTIFISRLSFGCEIHLPERMVVIGDSTAGASITYKDCNEQIKPDVVQILQNVEGKISIHQLAAMLADKGHVDFSIKPEIVQVTHLQTFIRDQLRLPPGIHIKSISVFNVPKLLNLAVGDRVEVRCDQCLFGNKQPVNLTINGFDGMNRSFTAFIDFKKMVSAWRLITDVTSFSAIDPAQHLREEFIESIPHTELVTDLSSLKFYKTNKPLRSGQFLKFSDLNSLNLVRAGLKTEVILENRMIRIKTHGISRNNGALGDVVEVFHQQKNKKYQGKVVDINKVLVEL